MSPSKATLRIVRTETFEMVFVIEIAFATRSSANPTPTIDPTVRSPFVSKVVGPVNEIFPTFRSPTTKTSPAKVVFVAVNVSAERRFVKAPISPPKEISPRPALTIKASELFPIATIGPTTLMMSPALPLEVIVEVPPPDKVTEFKNSIPPVVEVTPTLSIVAMLATFRALLKVEVEPLNVTPLLPVSVVVPEIVPPPVTPAITKEEPMPTEVMFRFSAVRSASSAFVTLSPTPPVPLKMSTPVLPMMLIEPVTPMATAISRSLTTTVSELSKVEAVVSKEILSSVDAKRVIPSMLPPPVTPLTVIDAPAPVAVIASDPACVMKSSSTSVRLSPIPAVPRKMSTPLLPVMLISPVTFIVLPIKISPALAIVSDARVALSPTTPANETCPAPAVNVKA